MASKPFIFTTVLLSTLTACATTDLNQTPINVPPSGINQDEAVPYLDIGLLDNNQGLTGDLKTSK